MVAGDGDNTSKEQEIKAGADCAEANGAAMHYEAFNRQKEKLMKNHPDIFKTDSDFWTYLRGAFRRSLWAKSPMKLRFKSETAIAPPPDYKGRGRKGHYCAFSGEWVSVSKSEVDHKTGNISLSCVNDVMPFIIHMMADADELQVVSKEMHKIKSYSDRMGISFESAIIDKKAIAIMKLKQDKEWLTERGINPASNAKKRREQIVEYLTKEANEV